MGHRYHWLSFFITYIFLASAQHPGKYIPNFCFNDKNKGSRLNTTLFTTTHVDKELDCLIVCDQEPCCRSVNFKNISSSHIEKNCEMLHNVVYNTSEKLLERDPSFDHLYFTSSEKEYNQSCLMPQGEDECSGGNHSCHVNARCVETIVSYHCECRNGYHGDGYNCTDIDECSEPTSNDCDLNATCINTNASYNCTCNIGFTGNGKECSDQFSESTILTNEAVEFKEKLMEWLPEGGKWRICWRATEHGWGGSTFHSKCDGKIPTLVIIKVVKDAKNLIFGGYSTGTWAGDVHSSSAPGSFMFSLRNNDNLEPFNATLRDQNDVSAIRTESDKGPIFGRGHDLEIGNDAVSSNTASVANFGSSYKSPSGYTFRQSKTQSLLAGSFRFRPSEVEVLYLN